MTASPLLTNQTRPLYDIDYAAWIEATLHKLERSDYANVDWENVIEEIADMGRSEKRGLESNLVIVLLHLLKWQYQPERRSSSWGSSLLEHRRRIRRTLEQSPSLKSYLESVLVEAYADSVKQAAMETGLSKEAFPEACQHAIAQILDDEFFPE